MNKSTPAVESQRQIINIIGNFTIIDGVIWTKELANTSSPEHKDLANQISKQLLQMWENNPFGNYQGISGIRFAKGSVVVQYKTKFSVANGQKLNSKVFDNYFTNHLTNGSKFGNFTILAGSVRHTILLAAKAEEIGTIPNWGIAVIVCGSILLLFIVFMVCVLWSGRHIRQKFRIPEDPEDVGYRRNWLSVPPYTSSDCMYAYENKGVVPDCKDDISKDPKLSEKSIHPEPPHSDYCSSNGMDMHSLDGSTLPANEKSPQKTTTL